MWRLWQVDTAHVKHASDGLKILTGTNHNSRFYLWPRVNIIPADAFLRHRKQNHQNDRPGAAYLTRASEVLGHAKVQHEELLLKIEVCAEELREYLGKSAFIELSWLSFVEENNVYQLRCPSCAGISVS